MAVTVTGIGSASGEADEAVVELELAVRRAKGGEALDALSGAVGVVFAVLEGGPATHYSSSGLGLGVDHDREGRPRGHRASQVVRIVVPVAEAGRLLADVVDAAGDDVGVRSLQQRSSDPDALRVQARTAAMAEAKAAATQHAELAQRRLGRLTEVVEGDSPIQPRPATRSLAVSAVPVAAGDDTVTVTVTATWELD